MKAQFEEKTYENYFNNELDRKSSIYFPLGQVQEGVIGIDSASKTRNRRLWRMLGHPFWFFPPFRGANLHDVASEMENYLSEEVRHIPQIKVNLLFQYKRPEYIKSSLGREWNSWHCPFFRYDIYLQQHELLVQLDRTFGQQALILYAAPAIHELNKLIELKLKNQIIGNSNFTTVSALTNHTRNTYTDAGTFSIAHSEPEKIEKISLLNLLERIKFKENFNNKEFIINTGRKTENIMSENTYYSKPFKQLIDKMKINENYPLLRTYFIMKTCSDLTGIQWLINISEEKEKQ